MKRSKLTEEQIIAILREQEAGAGGGRKDGRGLPEASSLTFPRELRAPVQVSSWVEGPEINGRRATIR